MRGKGNVGMVLLCVLLMHVPAVVSPSPSDDQELTLNHADLGENSKRVRREAHNNRGVEEFSEEDKLLFVEKHNEFRAQEGSSDMKYMYWDDNLAVLAKKWVKKCIFEHSPQATRSGDNVKPYSYVGENLYASSGTYDPAAVMKGWYEEEKDDYNYYTKACSHICGHYTQVVWATSHAVGCAVHYCEQLIKFGRGFYVSCNYGPGGNYKGESPYKKGRACSKCDKRDTPFCQQKLCARVPVVGDDAMSRGRPCLVLIGCSILMSLSVVTWILAPAFSL